MRHPWLLLLAFAVGAAQAQGEVRITQTTI